MSAEVKSKVAVIVVHGVAYHAPGASARAASELLHGSRTRNALSPYSPDVQETVSIPLHQLKISTPLKEEPPPSWVSSLPIIRWFEKALRERTVFLTRAWAKKAPSYEPANERVANDFMRLLLQDYRGVDRPVEGPNDHQEAASYVTTCIKMTRDEVSSAVTSEQGTPNAGNKEAEGDPATHARARAQKTEVHLYEMYWADLSRPKNTILSFFQGLYQLLFHVGSLSRLAISTGLEAAENRDRKPWKWLNWTQTWAVRILTLPIPILNLILLISLVGTLPHLIYGDEWVRRAAIVSSAVLGLIACGVASQWLPATRWPLTWVAIPLGFAIGFSGLCCLLVHFITPWSLLALEGWILGAGFLYLSVGSYDEVRDGAKEVAWALYGLSAGLFLVMLFVIRNHTTPLEQATLWMMQIVLAELRASWFLLIIFAFATLLLGSKAWRSLPRDSAERARAKAAVRSSRFALALPALGILIVTLALWSGLFVKTSDRPACPNCPSTSLATKLFGEKIPVPLSKSVKDLNFLKIPVSKSVEDTKVLFDRVEAEEYIESSKASGTKEDSKITEDVRTKRNVNEMTPSEYFRGLFVWSATPAFPIVLGLISVSMFLLLLWLLPSVFTEMKPPRGSGNSSSQRLGGWLSRGLDATAIGFALLWLSAFLMPMLFAVLHWWEKTELNSLDSPTAAILQWLGLATGSLAILASVAKSGSSVLGIILDVDNYLRTSPKEKTPRALIMERYVSLLRYVADDKVEARKYDRIVILAHSLGALISGDLLLYLKSQGDSDLARLGLGTPGMKAGTKIPIRLFTMGDPVRQFLNRMFPYLYEWVRSTPDNSLKHLGGLEETRPDDAPLAGTPDPQRLGVERWVNAYRSGDYIGRSIWLNEWYGRTTAGSGEYPQAISVAQDNAVHPTREEMCIGAGAHQHYWDQSAPDIAEKLDELISR